MRGSMNFIIITLLTICCQSTKSLESTTKDLSLQAINDLLRYWYRNDQSKEPCMNGTYKIEISDTLKWRAFKFASHIKVQNILNKYGIRPDTSKLAQPILKESENVDFISARAIFFSTPEKEPLCRQYYFSPLYKVNVSQTSPSDTKEKYVIQYIMKSYELYEECLLLLSFDSNKFTVNDDLECTFVWD